MPVVDQKAGNCYIWVISGFLFLCIVAGGTFLALYMTELHSPSNQWYPFAGVSLVCLPWFFWFLTFFYRVISRACGFHMACWGASFGDPGGSVGGASLGRGVSIGGGGGGGGRVGGAIDGNGTQSETVAVGARDDSTHSGDGTRRVHFGGAMVVGEQEGNESSARTSHSGDSELPLKQSMAS
ncbi:hypothetical protein Ancab_024341 [Ancistrocladus abbreviatus]